MTKIKTNTVQPFTTAELIAAMPQKTPFLFIDKILSVNDDHIKGVYTFKPTEFFYHGHFPGNPLTPGVILLESMAQVGLVAFALYLASKELARTDMRNLVTFFTDANVEFLSPIKPGDTIHIYAEKMMWRRKKLKSHAEVRKTDGSLVSVADLAGMGKPLA